MLKSSEIQGKILYGHLWDFRYNRIPFLQSLPQYGDIISLQFGFEKVFVVHHPQFIQQILIEQADRFQKLRLTRNLLRKANNSDAILRKTQAWRKRRHLIQGKLHTQYLHQYGVIINDVIYDFLKNWDYSKDINIYQKLKRITLRVASLVLFGTELKDDEQYVLDAVETLQTIASQRFDTLVPPAPMWTNLPNPRRIKQAIATLDSIVAKYIDSEKMLGEYGNTLLATLIQLRAKNNNISISSIREEMISLLMSAHETVATSLAWTFYLLAMSEGKIARLETEVANQLGTRPVTVQDLHQIPYAKAIIQESMRLYPPAWTISRQVIQPTVLADIEIPIGARVFINPITLHRDERWFVDPHTFDPERFIQNKLVKYSYLPFSTGERKCIGSEFAMMEAQMILITIVQHLHFHLDNLQEIEPEALITLRPSQPILLTFERKFE